MSILLLWLSGIIAALLLMMAITHIILGLVFARRLDRDARKIDELPRFDSAPAVAILLPLRGPDPFLERTIRALEVQDYPELEIHVIVDHPTDEAFKKCEEIFARSRKSNQHLHVIPHPSRATRCGLKCSALLHAMDQLDEAVEVVALIDSDVVPHSTWLRELVAPLAEPSIGVTTGNQWFEPDESRWGSCVRATWNAGAMVPTALLRHPWAGTCAMRKDDMHRSGLLDSWGSSIVDDGPIAECLARLDLECQFVPSLIMINREQCDSAFCLRYIRRMLTWSRLFESTYAVTVLHAAVLLSLTLAAVLLGGYELVIGRLLIGGLAWGSLLFFWIANWIGFRLIRGGVMQHAHVDRAPVRPLSLAMQTQQLASVPFTHLIYAWSAFRACFVRQVSWRGITYRLGRDGRVEMMEYVPFVQSSAVSDAETSV